MANLLLNKRTRLRVKAYEAPLTGDRILGEGVDVETMPDGHLSCPMCQNPYFECWVYLDTHRLEAGCTKCGWSARLLFPLDVDLTGFGGAGKWCCFKHPKGEMVIIKNSDVLCVGCRYDKSEVQIKLKSKSNLVLA